MVVVMKSYQIFPGIILIGFGAYFLLKQINIAAFQPFFTWPTLLIIVGIGLLFQGYGAKDYHAILPGVILTGFGLHFHIADHLNIWPEHTGIFMLIIALGFLLQSQKTGYSFQGFLLLIFAFLLLFKDKADIWFNSFGGSISAIWKYWPLFFIVFGTYFLIRKRK